MATASDIVAAALGEEYIVIGNDRRITIPANLKRLAVQFDHDIETVTFKCPRYWDNHDMSEMAVYVNYMRSDGYKDRYPVNVDENGHIQSVKAEGDVMFFNWTISRNVTQVKGNVSFLICVMKTDAEGNEERHWNSELSQEAYISEGMECEESPVDMYPDIVTQLLLRMATVEQINVQAEEMQAIYDATVEVANTAEETKNQALDASNYIKNSYASAIKPTVSGEMIHVKDVSPIGHDVKCLVHGKNLCNLSVLPIHEPSDPAVYISDVGTDYIDVTASPTYNGNGHVQTSVRLKELCPQMRVGKQYILSGISDAWNKCVYLRALDYFWNFGYPITATQEMLDCTVGFYGYAPFRGQAPGVCRISNIQIEEGSVATEYESYIDPTTANVTRCGKNILRLMSNQTAYGVTINVDANEIVTISGTSTQGVNMHVGKAIVKAGRKYKPIVELYSGKVELKYWDEAIGIQTHPDANGYISSTKDAEITVFIYAAEAGAVFNGRFKVMFVLADDELDKVYEKYSLSKAIPSSDGSCVFTSKSPTMTLYTDTPGVTVEAEYNANTKTWVENYIRDNIVIVPGGEGGSVSWLTNVSLPASAWTGSDSLYSQVVTIAGTTKYSKVDLLPSIEQLAIFHDKDVAFVTENENGVITVYAIGDKPTQNYTMQAQITEVMTA